MGQMSTHIDPVGLLGDVCLESQFSGKWLCTTVRFVQVDRAEVMRQLRVWNKNLHQRARLLRLNPGSVTHWSCGLGQVP